MASHRIVLRGPWKYRWLVRDGQQADSSALGRVQEQTGTVKLPADWRSLFGDVSGTVELRRKFNWPNRLPPEEDVSIAFDGVGGNASVNLNGMTLGTIDEQTGPVRFGVTRLLRSHNEVCVDLSFDALAAGDQIGGLWAPVAIEIG